MRIVSCSVRQTEMIGRAIARCVRAGDIICLAGDLGAGKTVLARGLSAGLGVRPELVISPTFVLMRRYPARIPVYHLDLYRLQTCQEIADIGYEDFIFSDGVSVIEWADRMQGLLPEEFLRIELSIRAASKRLLVFSSKGKRYATLMRCIHEHISG